MHIGISDDSESYNQFSWKQEEMYCVYIYYIYISIVCESVYMAKTLYVHALLPHCCQGLLKWKILLTAPLI